MIFLKIKNLTKKTTKYFKSNKRADDKIELDSLQWIGEIYIIKNENNENTLKALQRFSTEPIRIPIIFFKEVAQTFLKFIGNNKLLPNNKSNS